MAGDSPEYHSPASLKRDLRRLMKVVLEDEEDGCGGEGAEVLDEALRVVSALRDCRLGCAANERSKVSTVPEYFLCPISSEIMRDPVIVASGQTYDRPFIEDWLKSGKRSCPKSQQVLSDTTLIPNHLVSRMISKWCAAHGFALPTLENQEEAVVTKNDRSIFSVLLNMISSPSVTVRKRAVKDLRLLTKRNKSIRAAMGEHPDAISHLVNIPFPTLLNDSELLEDTVTTLLNLSIHESNKKIIGDDQKSISLLIEALKCGTMTTRCNSAAALFSLSALDCLKPKIAELGGIMPLVNLLEHGSQAAKKDAATALFNLCTWHDNKARAVSSGAVGVVLAAISDQSFVDESLALLALLSSNQEAVEAICDGSGVECLLFVLRKNTCKQNKENAAAILYAICMYDRRHLREIQADEDLHGTISGLLRNGTQRARRKAAGILERIRRSNRAHHSC